MREHLKSSVFKRYVYSYLIVFLIPFLIFFILLNIVYIQSLHRETINAYESNIRQVSLQMDEDLREFNFVSDQINQSYMFSSVRLNGNSSSNEQVESLQRYELGTDAIQDIFVILNDQSTVYSSRGTMPMYGLLNNTRYFDVVEDEKNDLLDLLSSSEETLSTFNLASVNPNGPMNKVVYHTSPLNVGSRDIGTLVIVASTSSIDYRLNLALEGEDIALLLDEDSKIISSHGLSTDQHNLLEDLDMDGINNINGTLYTPIIVENTATGWKIVNLIELSRVFSPLMSTMFIFIAILVGVFIVGVIISNYFARINYKPVREIVQNFGKSDDAEEYVEDEWTFIEKNVQLVQEERTRLENQVKKQQEVFRNSTLNRLFSGNYPNEKYIRERLEEVQIELPYKYFAVSVIQFGDESLETDSLTKIEEFVSLLNESDLRDYEVELNAMVSFTENNLVLILINSENKDIIKMNSNLRNELIKTSVTEQAITVATSDMHEEFNEINQAYVEASATLEDLINTNEVSEDMYRIGYFSDMKPDEGRIDFSSVTRFYRDDALLLTQSIKQANNQVAFSIVDRLFDSLDTRYQEEFTNQLLYTTLFGTVIKAADDMNINLENFIENTTDNLTNVEDMRQTIKNMIMIISEQVKSRQELDSTELESKVVAYVYENFASSTISLEEIASEYNISTSYVSKLISEETGESFTQILQKLRMEYFKELLVTTKRPIKDLVKEIGYYDVSNFTRKFREENDMTPSQYRKANKQKN